MYSDYTNILTQFYTTERSVNGLKALSTQDNVNFIASTTPDFITTLQLLLSHEHHINAVLSSEDDATCTACKQEEQTKHDELRKNLPAIFDSIFDGVCHSLWPALAPYFGNNMCDPAVPGECYMLCHGMVTVYKYGLADVFAFLFHDPERTCFHNNKCPINPDTIPPAVPVPQTLPQRSGDRSVLREIFHITDIHYDKSYDANNGVPRCKLPVCCHKAENTTIVGDMNYNTFNTHEELVYDEAQQVQKQHIDFIEEDDNFHHYNKPQQRPTAKQRFSLTTPRHENNKPHIMGEYLCDSPQVLMEASTEQILLHCPDYVVYSGDSPAHDLWKQTFAANLDAVQTVNSMLERYSKQCSRQYMSKLRGVVPSKNNKYNNDVDDDAMLKSLSHEHDNKKADAMQAAEDLHYSERFDILFAQLTPRQQQEMRQRDKRRTAGTIQPEFFPVLGNHAAAPVNAFAGFGGYDDWLLKPLSEHWANFLNADAVKTTRFGGFYVQPTHANTYVIGLHTGLLDVNNPWRVLNLGYWDPSGQFSIFLQQVLQKIAAMQGKVIMVYHEPHGDIIKGTAKEHMFMLYVKYRSLFIGFFCGHQHHDLTQLLHNNYPVNLTSTMQQHDYFNQLQYLSPLMFDNDIAQKVLQPQFNMVKNTRGVSLAYPLTANTPYSQLFQQFTPLTAMHSVAQQPQQQQQTPSALDSYLNLVESIFYQQQQRMNKLTMTKTTSGNVKLPQLNYGNANALKLNPLWQFEPLHVELLPSSVTPYDYSTNPSFRVLDLVNTMLTDYRQYTFDIIESRQYEAQNRVAPTAIWKETYSYRGLYGKYSNATVVDGPSWHALVQNVFTSTDEAVKNQFYKEYVDLHWGFVPAGIDPEFQPGRWSRDDMFCTIYTHSNVERSYCLDHLHD